LEIFGDPILQCLIMTVYFGSKSVSKKEIPIGLRWVPTDRRLPRELFPYCGMLVSSSVYLVEWAIAVHGMHESLLKDFKKVISS